MSVSIGFNFPKELSRNATVRMALKNIAEFVRDLWLARSPYASGDYSRGLQKSDSIRITSGSIQITNSSKHAWFLEKGIRSFNLGMAILNSGKGVKRTKDGDRYKIISVKPKPSAAFRKASVAQAAIGAFKKTMPIGIRPPQLTKYGALKPYKARHALNRPIKGKKPSAGAMEGIFVISEKAIRNDPSKWRVPSRDGIKLGERIQKEARPYVVAALRKAVQAEQNRQMSTKGIRPQWSPDLRSVLTMVPADRGKK